MSPTASPSPSLAWLQGLLLRRREQLGLSLRETARQVGISPSYLVALEQGRNPSTGRASVPSLPILLAFARVLGIDVQTLIAAAGGAPHPSVHVLLYQAGARPGAPLDAARTLFAGRVESWIEIVDPRSGDAGLPADDVLVRRTGSLLSTSVFESVRARDALSDLLRESLDPATASRLGIVFGANSSLLRSIENPVALLEAERTWEDDVAAAFRTAVGDEPVANVCVYREADLQELSARLDPLAAVLHLIQTHPHISLQESTGALTSGPAAVEAILMAARPAGVSTETWESLTRAAAAGLARTAAIAHAPAAPNS